MQNEKNLADIYACHNREKRMVGDMGGKQRSRLERVEFEATRGAKTWALSSRS